MNPLAIAIQGLGFDAALVAVQGFMMAVVEEIKALESAAGGGLRTRRKVRRATLGWLENTPLEEDEALLLACLL